ncbi:hypothetical protein CRM22_005018 [Opisthorchis felineus]|uniref:Uncharacterized protein n=1 Tax=Opisthorchis felineus TaxID=147828 RepID=A0A4S2LUA4_OPIFE|nr:hypothetical protein CRM22_005018 [Opisthorchis felineus]
MGNRNTHRSPVDLPGRYLSADKAHFRAANNDVDSYFQPPSFTLEEYLRSRPHPYGPETVEAFEEQPLKQLSYREAYDHLRDLADQQLRKAHDALTEMNETMNFSAGSRNKRMLNSDNLTTTFNREKNKRLHDWWAEQQGLSTLSNVRQISHGLPSGVGDSISPSSINHSPDTDSEDTAGGFEEPANKQHQVSARYLETPYDIVAKTGDARTISLSSSNPDSENLIVKAPVTQNKAQHFRKPQEVHVEEISSKSMSLVRNLRTLQTPAENNYYFEKAITIDRPFANIPVCREPTQRADLRRSYTFVNHDPKLERVTLSPNKFNCHLGFHRLPDGRVTYTAYVHSGPSGVPIAGWLPDLQKRASRHLIGLRRQHRCDIHFDPQVIPYRGLFVHAMVISGQTQSDLIRFRNSLPACIQNYMITPVANHSASLRRRGTFRNVS